MNLQEIIDIRNLKLKELNKEISSLIAPAFQEFFDKYPQLLWFSWRQYTPYFNDWDSCKFSVYAEDINMLFKWCDKYKDYPCYTFSRIENEEERLRKLTEQYDSYPIDWETMLSLSKEIIHTIYSIPYDILKDTYWEWEIYIERNNIEWRCEYYYHD